jgi:hypothetical protein
MKTLGLLVSSALMFMNVESNWVQQYGALKQLDVDGSRVCGVNSSSDFWCKENLNVDWQLQ